MRDLELQHPGRQPRSRSLPQRQILQRQRRPLLRNLREAQYRVGQVLAELRAQHLAERGVPRDRRALAAVRNRNAHRQHLHNRLQLRHPLLQLLIQQPQLFASLRNALFQIAIEHLQCAFLAMQLRKHADLRAQHLRNNRNRDIVHRAALIPANAIQVRQVNRGDEDDRRLLKARMLTHHVRQFKAVDLRHADVHQHHRNIALQQMVQRLPAGVRLHQVLAQILKNRLVAQQLRRLIVHHQNGDRIALVHRNDEFVGLGDRRPHPCSRVYLCSHVRKPESSWSVLTGFAMYSEAPASRHFSRSPFMAFAVSAIIGSRRRCAFCRITCIVSYPSISGIMISISTIAMSGVLSSIEIASRPVPAVSTVIPRRSKTLLSATMLRTSSSTTSTLRPTSASSEPCSRSSMRCLSGGRSETTRCRNNAVSSSSRSGDSTSFTTTLRASVRSRASSSGASSLPVNTTTGSSTRFGDCCMRSSTSTPDISGSLRSSTTQSNFSSSALASASFPLSTTVMSMSSDPSSSVMLNCSAGLSSTISSFLRRGLEYSLIRVSAASIPSWLVGLMT